ncbi:MAG TPA: HAD-IA family hydrolase, partial [Candidatus Binatia bacterium]|nr:HAD-IA family hydrolase [Candidatus Binatia bacterium]
VPGAARAALVAEFRAHHRERCLWRLLDPDAVPTLDALRARGLALGVVSNADGRIEADLARLGVRDRLVTVVDSHVVGVEKPDPAVFRLALDAMGVSAAAALYVGDLYAIDVVGARRAGLEAVLLDPLDRYPGDVDCPRITRLGALLDLLP